MSGSGRLRSWLAQLSPATRAAAQGIAVTVGLVVLVWGAEVLARWGAESLLARNVQLTTGVIEQPKVRVEAGFFLPQVIRGAYNDVHVVTGDIRSGPLRIESIDSRLGDVRQPFSAVLLRDVSRIGIGHSRGVARLTYADLNAFFAATGRPVRLEPTPAGGLRLGGTVDVLGQSVTAAADVVLLLEDGNLQLDPREIDAGNASLGAAGRALLEQRLTLSVPLGALPFGHRLTAATPRADGIEIDVQGRTLLMQP